MNKIPFNIKYRKDIENKKYRVVDLDNNPVEIIYWERDGSINGNAEFQPVIGLRNNGKEIIESTKDGKIYTAAKGSHQGLFLIDNNDFYDFTQMKPFTPVLVRNEDNQTWFAAFFDSFNGNSFRIIGNEIKYQCMPYKGHETFQNTIKPIDPYYDLRLKRLKLKYGK